MGKQSSSALKIWPPIRAHQNCQRAFCAAAIRKRQQLELRAALQLEQSFHKEMVANCRRVFKETGYQPIRLRRMVSDRGGLATAKELMHDPVPADGFVALLENKRLELSVEALVCRRGWRSLFASDEIAVAAKRLRSCGYEPDEV